MRSHTSQVHAMLAHANTCRGHLGSPVSDSNLYDAQIAPMESLLTDNNMVGMDTRLVETRTWRCFGARRAITVPTLAASMEPTLPGAVQPVQSITIVLQRYHNDHNHPHDNSMTNLTSIRPGMTGLCCRGRRRSRRDSCQWTPPQLLPQALPRSSCGQHSWMSGQPSLTDTPPCLHCAIVGGLRLWQPWKLS